MYPALASGYFQELQTLWHAAVQPRQCRGALQSANHNGIKQTSAQDNMAPFK